MNYYKNEHGAYLKRISETSCLIVKETGITIASTLTPEEIDKVVASMEKCTKGEFIAKSRESLKTIKTFIK